MQPLCEIHGKRTRDALEWMIDADERRIDVLFDWVATEYLDVPDGSFGDPRLIQSLNKLVRMVDDTDPKAFAVARARKGSAALDRRRGGTPRPGRSLPGGMAPSRFSTSSGETG